VSRTLFRLAGFVTLLFLLALPVSASAATSSGRAAVSRRRNAPAPTARRRPRKPVRTVAIDIGHGGKDPGAIGVGSLAEKRIALDVGLRLARLLRRRGVRVALSRSSDRSLPPAERLRWTRTTRAHALVSVHCDAAPAGRVARGATTYYRCGCGDSRRLARQVQVSLVAAARTSSRGIRPDTTRYRRGFYLLRAASPPAVLVELGYVTHPTTAQRLRRASYRQRLARGIAAGVAAFLRR
jgi:N-acetylmuramoyl-L-alanine amidase